MEEIGINIKSFGSHCPLKPIIFPLQQVQRFIFSDDVAIMPTVLLAVAWPFTGKFTGKLCDVTILLSGAPNDGFFPDVFKRLSRVRKSTLRSLEMHYNQRCKICICSVILGELKAFRNYKGLSVILSKSLDAIEHFTKLTIFLISHSIIFLNPEIKGFLFLQKLAKMRTKM